MCSYGPMGQLQVYNTNTIHCISSLKAIAKEMHLCHNTLNVLSSFRRHLYHNKINNNKQNHA